MATGFLATGAGLAAAFAGAAFFADAGAALAAGFFAGAGLAAAFAGAAFFAGAGAALATGFFAGADFADFFSEALAFAGALDVAFLELIFTSFPQF